MRPFLLTCFFETKHISTIFNCAYNCFILNEHMHPFIFEFGLFTIALLGPLWSFYLGAGTHIGAKNHVG
jgi:hypothetical protein